MPANPQNRKHFFARLIIGPPLKPRGNEPPPRLDNPQQVPDFRIAAGGKSNSEPQNWTDLLIVAFPAS
jgi:hypothetical protein